jgi:hypothetical protein
MSGLGHARPGRSSGKSGHAAMPICRYADMPPKAEVNSEHQSSGLGRVFLTRTGIQFVRKRYGQRQGRKHRVTSQPASSSAWRLSAAPPARPRARSTSGVPR